MIELADAATEEITVTDVLAGALSLAGLMVLVAVVLAVLFAGALIGLRRLGPSNPLGGNETKLTSLDLHLPSR